ALHEIASLSYAWGWGKPPCSLTLKVTRLATLAGMPGSEQGRVQFYIPPEERDEARALVESIRGPGSAGSVSPVEQARQTVTPPALGLLATGVLGLLSWVVIGMTLASFLIDAKDGDLFRENLLFWLFAPAAAALLGVLAAVQTGGAVMMLRLRGYAW